MSRPAWWMVPALCRSSPAMMRRSVVFPQPEGPRKQTNSPGVISRSTSFSAVKAPKFFEIPCRRMQGKSLLVRFRDKDSKDGVTRRTLKKVASALGLSETEAIHRALVEYAHRH